MEASISATRLSGGLIAAISLIVGGIGITNIMLASITERVREIGIRLAVGARGADIFLQILVESVSVAFIGGIIGIAAGFGLIKLLIAVAPSENVPFVSLDSIVISVVFAVIAGVLSGFIRHCALPGSTRSAPCDTSNRHVPSGCSVLAASAALRGIAGLDAAESGALASSSSGISGLLVLYLARPEWNLTPPGMDLVVLMDRSASAAEWVEPHREEIERLLEVNRGANDQLRIVDFAAAPLERAAGRPFESPRGETRMRLASSTHWVCAIRPGRPGC